MTEYEVHIVDSIGMTDPTPPPPSNHAALHALLDALDKATRERLMKEAVEQSERVSNA